MDRHRKRMILLRLGCLLLVVIIIAAFYLGVWLVDKYIAIPIIKAVKEKGDRSKPAKKISPFSKPPVFLRVVFSN